jgi:hypothetical protein
MFGGKHIPQNFSETYDKYADMIRLYLFCCDREKGTISVSPMEVLDWPYRFFITMTMIKNEFIGWVNDMQKKELEKSKRFKGRRKARP